MNLQRGQAILDCSLIIRSVFMRVIDTSTQSTETEIQSRGNTKDGFSLFLSEFFQFYNGDLLLL